MDTLGFSSENIRAVVTGSGVEFTGLLPGVTYSINVISVASGGKQTPSANLNLTTSPITPTGIVITNITNTGFTVGWNVDPGTTSHSFQINEIEVIPSLETLTYAIISTLNANTLYTLGVSAVNAGGSTPAANTVQVRTAPAPASNFLSTVTTTTILVRWSGSEGAVSFTYSLNGAPVIPSSSQTTVAPFSATFSGLTPDTPYTFIVTGRGSGGSTTDSQPYAIATDGPPKQLSSNNINQTTFGLAWKGSIDSATYTYLINGNPPSFYSMNVATVGRTAAFSGASPNTTYSIVVVKSTPTPPLSSPPFTVITLPLPPTAPVVTSSVTTTSITLTWTGSPTALSFSYSINGSTVIPATTGYQTATFTGLQPFTTYSSVRVIATNAGGSTPSTPLFITTLPLPPVAPVLSYNNLTNQGFTVLWQSITGASSYSYTINGIAATPDVYSPTSATFGSLSGNTNYTVLVTAINITGSTSSSPLIVTTLMNPPLPPTNLLATVVGSTRLTIAWTVGAGTTGYIYTLNGSRYTPFSTTVNSATFTGLIANQLYNIIITSVNNGGTADSEFLEVITNRPTPEVPVLVVSEITQTNFIVSWQPNSGATTYAYTVDGIPNSVVTVLSENSIYLSGFLPNTIHTLIVTSTNNSGRFVSSTTLSVTTLRSRPSAFTLLPGTITSNSISVTWTPIVGVTGYTFQLDGIDVTPTSSNYSSNATFGSLNSNQGYTITVIATNNGGSTPSNISLTTYMTPPTAPTALTSNSITSTSFSITWTPGTGASSYSYTLNGIPTAPLLSNTNSATFNNLASNTNYNVIVIATNNGGSASSATLQVMTLLAPPSPFSITSSSITSSSFIISWTPSTATSYTYTLNGQSATPTPITASSVSFTGLIANSAYNVIVTATNNSGILVPSSPTLTVTTLMIAPTAATNLQFTSITSSGFTVSWTAGLRVTSYTYTLNGSLATPSSSTATTATFTGLAANAAYNVIVISTNNGGSAASTAASVTTNMAPPSAPVLIAGTITNTSATVSWQSGTGATSYTYTLGGSPATPASTTATSATFNGLTPDTPYNIIVTAVNNSGVPAASNPLSIRTLLNAPSAPVITSSALTSNGFLISWQTGTGATSYSYTLNGSSATPSSSTATSATFTALAPNTPYSVIVTAINNGGSTASNTLQITTNMAPPSAPVLVAGTITNTSATVSWQSGTGATSYTYTLGGSPATPASTTATSATFNGLTPDTPYNIIVTAVNNSGVPAASNPLSIRTLLNAPLAPVITSSALTSNGFLISWQTGTGATSYSYTLNGSSATPSSSTATSATFTALAPNTPYSVIVTAINNGGSATSNTLQVTTNMGPPSAPNLSQGAVAETQFTVNWQVGTGASSYTYTLNSNTVTPSSTTTTSATFTGLTANTSYSVVVTAINNSGAPAPSNPLSITTLMVPPTSLSLTSSLITSSSFVVSWQPNSGATSYAYSLNGTTATPSTTTSTSATFTGLIANRNYLVAVTAINTNPIQRTSSITIRTIIDPPTGLTPSSVSYTSFTLNWSGSSGATTYRFLLNSSTATPTYTSGATVASFTGLNSGTLYSVQVVATDGSYNSLPSTASPVTTLVPPDPITYSSSGTPLPNSYTVPAGFAYAYIEALAGSGGGGGGFPKGGIGGGGGAYVYGTVAIGTGSSISITQPPITGGAGGAGGSSQSPYWQFPGSDGMGVNFNILGNNITIQGGGGGNGGTYTGSGWGPNGNITTGNPTNPRSGQGGTVTGTLPSGLFGANGNNAQNDYTEANGSSGGAAGNPNYGGGHGGSNTPGYTRGVNGLPGYYNIRLVYTLAQLNKPLLHGSAFTATGFTVTWQALSGVTNYTYTLDGVAAGTTTSQIAVFSGKASGSTYSVVVTANYPSQPSVPSDTLSVTTLPAAPVITASAITSFGFTVNWQSGTGATSYSYLLNDVSVTPVSQTATSATFNSLLGDTVYAILVTAINGSNTAVSNQLSITTLIPPPIIYSSEGQQITGTPVSGFTTFNAPAGYKYIYMELLAGCGTSSSASNGYYSAGGGGGAYLYGTLTITPSTQIQMGYVTNDNSNIPGGGTVIGGSGSVKNGYRVILVVQGYTYTAFEGTGAGNGSVAQQGNGGAGGYPPTSLGVVTAISGSNGTGSTALVYGIGGASGRGDTFGGSGATSISDTRIAPGDNGAYLVVFAGSISQITNIPFLYNRSVSFNSLRVGWQNGMNLSSYTFTLNGVTRTPSSSTSTSATFSGLTSDTSYNIIMDAIYNGVNTPSTPITIRTLAPPIIFSSFGTPLPSSYTVPPRYTRMYVEILAGSAGGAGCGLGTNPSNGGGGGAYYYGTNDVGANDTIQISTNIIPGGAGGAASNNVAPLPGGNGTSVIFTKTTSGSSATAMQIGAGNGGNCGAGFGSGWNPPSPSVENGGRGGEVTRLSGPSNIPGLIIVNGNGGQGSTFQARGPRANSGKAGYTAGEAGQGAIAGEAGVGGYGDAGYYLISFSANGTTQSIPGVPSINSSSITSVGFTLVWSLDTNVNSYGYRLNGNLVTPASSTTTSATFTSLASNTSYNVAIIAINAGGSTLSNTLSVTTLRTAPTAPVISSSAITSSGFTVSWSADANVASYTYRIGSGSEVPVSGTSVNLTGLSANTSYQVVLTAINNGGSTASNTLATTTLRTAPIAPVISSSAITSSGFTVSWSADANVTSYTYRIGSGSEIPVTGTSVNLTGLSANTSYQVVLTATNNGGTTASNTLSVTTLRTKPTAPSISSSAITLTSFVVNWQSDANVTSYIYTLNGVSATPSSSNSTSATFTSLSSSTTYDVVVTARNNGGDTNSNTLPVRTLTPPYSPPVSVTINNTAIFSGTKSMTLDSANNVYFTVDAQYLYKIDTGGNGSQFGYIPEVAQQFARYSGVTFANTFLYIIDGNINGFWKLNTGGSLVSQYKDDLLKGCWNSSTDGSGNLYALNGNVANLYPNTTVGVRKLDLAGNITTVVSSGTLAPLNNGSGLGTSRYATIDSSGSFYISDQTNNNIVKVTNGVASIFATRTGLGIDGVGDIGIDSYGNLFIVAGEKLLFINKTTAQIVYTYTEPTGTQIQNACMDTSGTIWFYSRNGSLAFLKKLFKT